MSRKSKRLYAGILIATVLLSLGACRKQRGSATSGELHPITVRVHPAGALVKLEQPQQKVVAVIEQRGPVAAFRLPEGSYRYEVTAPGFQTYQGHFSIPENQHLEVWLSR